MNEKRVSHPISQIMKSLFVIWKGTNLLLCEPLIIFVFSTIVATYSSFQVACLFLRLPFKLERKLEQIAQKKYEFVSTKIVK